MSNLETAYEKAHAAAGDIGVNDTVKTRWGRALVLNAGPKKLRVRILEGGPSGMELQVLRAESALISKGEAPKKSSDKEHTLLVREIYKHTDPDNRISKGGKHEIRDRRKGGTTPQYMRENIVLENLSKDELRALAAELGITIGAKGKTAKLTPDERIARIRKIHTEHQWDTVEGIKVDGYTASAIIQVYDHLNDANKAKLAACTIPKMASVAFSMLKK